MPENDLLLGSAVSFILNMYIHISEVYNFLINFLMFCFLVLLPLAAPPFIMVDYGHFQYNCVSLGLTVLAIVLLFSEHISASAILFTLAVHHKQMSLYHSLSFAAYMFGTVVMKRGDLLTTFRVGTVILSTIGLMWLPFGDYWTFVFQRIFPLKRGVFEDKVGTFWYVLDRFIPIKGVYPDNTIAELCAISTVLLLLPSTFHHFCRACSTVSFLIYLEFESLLNNQVSTLMKCFINISESSNRSLKESIPCSYVQRFSCLLSVFVPCSREDDNATSCSCRFAHPIISCCFSLVHLCSILIFVSFILRGKITHCLTLHYNRLHSYCPTRKGV